MCNNRDPAQPKKNIYIYIYIYILKTWVLFFTTAMITITKAGVHFPKLVM